MRDTTTSTEYSRVLHIAELRAVTGGIGAPVLPPAGHPAAPSALPRLCLPTN